MQEQPNSFDPPVESQAPAYGAPIPAPTGQMYGGINTGVNDSGTGATAVLPEELKGFNWGACLLHWIWSIAHNTWIGLLTFLFGIIMMVILGFKGNEWAWQNRKWDSIEQFRETQKVWAKWGIGLTIVLVVFYALFFSAIMAMVSNAPRTTTTTTTTFQPAPPQ